MARYAKAQLLYLQMTMLKEDSSYARYILSMQTTGLCYTTVEAACLYYFGANLFCHASTNFNVENLTEFDSYQILHLCTQNKIVSEYDQEIPQSQTADNPVAPRGRAAQPSRDTRKAN